MIVYLDLEHERLRREMALWQFFASKTLETKYRLEAISGELCMIVHYQRVNPALLAELRPGAVIVGGHYTGLWHYAAADLAGLRAVLREAAWPMLGICGGLHLIATTYGAETKPIADDPVENPETPLPPGAPASIEVAVEAGPGQERGFLPVRILEPHPLFAGLGRRPVFFELHSWKVEAPPRGFRVLADSDVCSVQVLAHERAPLFGVQFHPEVYDEKHLDGRQLLANFLKLAGVKG